MVEENIQVSGENAGEIELTLEQRLVLLEQAQIMTNQQVGILNQVMKEILTNIANVALASGIVRLLTEEEKLQVMKAREEKDKQSANN
jgi:hypothetical protein